MSRGKKPRTPVLPPKLKKKLDSTHTAFHCIYWAHATMSELSLMTPVYAGLFVLTLALHFMSGHSEETSDE